MRKCFSMLLGAGIIALLTSCNFSAIPNDGKLAKDGLNRYVDWSNGDNGNGSGGGGSSTGLYKVADGYEMGAWSCWEPDWGNPSDGDSATVTDGVDGGVRISPNKRPCDSTYAGVNLAAGTSVGKNSDLDGKGFTKVVFKLRGNISSDLFWFYGINANNDACGESPGKDDNGKPIYNKKLSDYDTGSKYNDTSWEEFTIPLPTPTNAMSSALTIHIDNDPNWSEDKWIEIKDIDWQDADGKSVVPEYVD